MIVLRFESVFKLIRGHVKHWNFWSVFIDFRFHDLLISQAAKISQILFVVSILSHTNLNTKLVRHKFEKLVNRKGFVEQVWFQLDYFDVTSEF